jgi:GT2 family glycosyltransferase
MNNFSSKPFFSILILNWNGCDRTLKCIEAVREQTFQDFEIIVVDNGSTDLSIPSLRKLDSIKLIELEKNFGFAEGNNRGIPYCSGKYIFFLNNDAYPDNFCLQMLHATLSIHSDAIVGPLMLQYYNPDKIDSAGDFLYTCGTTFKFANWPKSFISTQEFFEIQCVCGGAACYPAEAIKLLDGFDNDFFLTCEDLDLSLRARHLGFKIYLEPKAIVYHEGSATMGSSGPIDTYYYYRNLFWLKIKNYPLITILKQFPASLFLFCLIFYVLFNRKLGFVFFRARIHQILGLSKMLKKRKIILSNSKISRRDFESHFRKNWFKEKLLNRMLPSCK